MPLVNTDRLVSPRRYLMAQQRDRRFACLAPRSPLTAHPSVVRSDSQKPTTAEACPVHVLCSNDSYASKQVKPSPFSASKCLRRRSAAFTAASHAEGHWFDPSRDHKKRRGQQLFGGLATAGDCMYPPESA